MEEIVTKKLTINGKEIEVTIVTEPCGDKTIQCETPLSQAEADELIERI